MPITERYNELEGKYFSDTIFEIINDEFFNGELKLDINCDFVVYHINDRQFSRNYIALEYLESLYNLNNIKRKIDRL